MAHTIDDLQRSIVEKDAKIKKLKDRVNGLVDIIQRLGDENKEIEQKYVRLVQQLREELDDAKLTIEVWTDDGYDAWEWD